MNNSSNQTIELLTVKEIADFLKVSAISVYRLSEERKIPFYKIRGSIRFDRNEVLKYLKKERFEPLK